MDAAGSMIIVGYAKLPSNSTSRATHELFSVSLMVEPPSTIIVAVDCNAATLMMRSWLSALLVGADIAADETPYLDVIERNYLGHAAGTAKQAVRDAWRRYASWAAKHEGPGTP